MTKSSISQADVAKTEPANFLKVKPNCTAGPDPDRYPLFSLFHFAISGFWRRVRYEAARSAADWQ
jgi:hypothetical protein